MTSDVDPLLDELRALEVELHHPGVRATRERLERLLHDEFHETGRSGTRYDRRTILDFLAAQAQRPSVRSDDFALTRLGDEAALLTYASCHVDAGGHESLHARRSSVWRRSAGGGWQLVHHQGTPAPDALPADSPADVVGPVQRQLDAYNARDLERFVAEYHDDVRVFRPPATEPVLSGKAAFGDHYARHRFSLPALHAALLSRMVAGRRVVDHERITGPGPAPVQAIAVYDVVDGRIGTVWFF